MAKFISFLIKALSIGLLIYFLVGISKGIYENKKDIKKLKVKIDENKKNNENLLKIEKNMEKRIDNLKDPKEVEKIAREVLNMKKADEEIYRVIEKDKK